MSKPANVKFLINALNFQGGANLNNEDKTGIKRAQIGICLIYLDGLNEHSL